MLVTAPGIARPRGAERFDREVVDPVAGLGPLRGLMTALENASTDIVVVAIPADLVKKVLAEKPKLVGLAVPGMPVGSPGMEMGALRDPYEIVAFDRAGKSWTYAKRA